MKAPARQIVALGRLLRDLSIPVGSDKIQLALEASEVLGLGDRAVFRDGLQASLLDSRDSIPVFQRAFELVFEQGLHTLSGLAGAENSSLRSAASPEQPLTALVPALDFANERRGRERVGGSSVDDNLQHADFARMTVAQLELAKKLVRALPMELPALTSRRWRSTKTVRAFSRLSLRATLRSSLGVAGEIQARYECRRLRPRKLVCLLDVSASMATYSVMFLQLLFALMAKSRTQALCLEVFVFGTELRLVTGSLRQKNLQLLAVELQSLMQEARAGTRIASSLQQFNRTWSARVQSRTATVLLVSDGLDHDDDGRLSAQTQRLQAQCQQLIWLNPLLRYPGFQAKARGVKAMLPHVDQFLPVHNVTSLRELWQALANPELFKQGSTNQWK